MEARKNDHQGNLGSLKSLLIGHGKRSHLFPRFVERERGGLQLIDKQWESDRSESILEMKERKV